jgi:tellurite resistance-related uncharacterized protein
LPAGLRRAHRVAERTWGRLRVLDGAVRLTIDTSPPISVDLDAGGAQAIPPTVTHALTVDGPVRLEVDFLVRPAG